MSRMHKTPTPSQVVETHTWDIPPGWWSFSPSPVLPLIVSQ